MKLKNMKLKITVLIIATLIVSLGLYTYSRNTGWQNNVAAEVNQGLSLVRPAFAQSMDPATSFLDQEAGISIYLNTGSSIDVNAAAAHLINIENKTSDWVIGSVPLVGFTSSDYPHCFVHKSGWIVVYYLKATSLNVAYVSKIIAWKSGLTSANSPLDDDKLKQALTQVCTPLGIPATNTHYYDFQYPNATTLLIVAKTTINGVLNPGVNWEATFNIKIPGNVTVYEQSYSHEANDTYHYYSHFKIDGQLIDTMTTNGAHYDWLPFLPANPLAPNSFHVVYVDGDGGTNYGGAYWCGICLTILYS